MGGGIGTGSRIDIGANPGYGTRIEARSDARARDHASDRAIERSNRNSVLHDGANGATIRANANVRARTDARTDGRARRTEARSRSQGPAHASATGIAHANQNSVLAGATTNVSLGGLSTGMIVRDTQGMTIGTVSRVIRSADGSVRNVLVATESGRRRIVPLAPETLTLSGDAVITTRLATSNQRR